MRLTQGVPQRQAPAATMGTVVHGASAAALYDRTARAFRSQIHQDMLSFCQANVRIFLSLSVSVFLFLSLCVSLSLS